MSLNGQVQLKIMRDIVWRILRKGRDHTGEDIAGRITAYPESSVTAPSGR